MSRQRLCICALQDNVGFTLMHASNSQQCSLRLFCLKDRHCHRVRIGTCNIAHVTRPHCVCAACRTQVGSLDSKAVFYWALAPMVAFYALFAAVLLPNANALQPVALAAKYCAQLVGS